MSLHEYEPNRSVTGFSIKWLFWGLGILVVIGAAGWAMGWITLPGRITSVQNVEAQWAFAYQYDEDLQAAARQACIAESALASAKLDTERIQRQSQLVAIEQNYSRIQADYNARLRNAFQAKLVAPSDVPREAPNLEDMKKEVCTEATSTESP